MAAPLIKRPDEFYVGFKKPETGTTVPLAFLTPFDNTAAFQKRKETVDNWAQGYGRWVNGQYVHDPHPEAKVIPNEPIAGFTIAKSVKRNGWNAGNVVWRIEDPRGFEWEIPSANMAQILIQSGVNAGVINGKCVIGRLGSNNILIPEGTDLWDQMEKDMDKRKAKASAKVIKDFNRGQWVTLKNGEEGWYLGQEHVMVQKNYKDRPGGPEQNGPSKEQYHLFWSSEYHDRQFRRISVYKNLHVIAVDDTKVLDPSVERELRSDKEKYWLRFAAGAPANTHAYAFATP